MIVDSYSYYVAAIPAKGKDDYAEELRIQKKEAELHTKLKLKVVKINNIFKLIEVRNKQKKDISIKIEPTTPYTLSQNNIAERVI